MRQQHSASLALLITTYNRPDALDLVLLSAARQRVPPDEVIVADDGSGDDTLQVITRHRESFPVPLVHIWHEDTGFRLAAIRNRAIASSSAEYIVMIDGDIVLHPQAIGAHRRFAEPDSYVQGSRALLGPHLTECAIREGRTRFSPFEDDVSNRLNALHVPLLRHLVPTDQDPIRATRGCHMAFWRRDVIRVNGFNEDFVGWGREDSEFAARLISSGVRRRNFKFDAIAYHLYHPSREQAADTRRNHAIFEDAWHSRRTRCERGIDAYLTQRQPIETPV